MKLIHLYIIILVMLNYTLNNLIYLLIWRNLLQNSFFIYIYTLM